jgi:hypothetical protein
MSMWESASADAGSPLESIEASTGSAVPALSLCTPQEKFGIEARWISL